jgi:hypothetical protein
MEVATPEPFFEIDPDELDIRFGVPGPQRRGSIALRAVLFVPLLALVGVVGVVGAILAVIGWFAAIALGRLPRWIAVFERKAIAYAIGVNAYVFLLADKYPPFAYPLGDYPIAVEINPSRLSRLRILFRWLLCIPASIVAGLTRQGLLVLSPVIWLSTLVLGRMPRPFFGAAAAVIRYEARYYAYMALLTDKYPRRLFGDAEWVPAPEGSGREFRVPLSNGARRLVRLIVVLGIAAGIANSVLPYELRSHPNPALVAAETRFERASLQFIQSVRRCGAGAKSLRCRQTQERLWGEAFDGLASSVDRIFPFSGTQASAALAFVHETRAMGRVLVAASKAKTAAGSDQDLLRVQGMLRTFERDAQAALGHGL